MENFDSIISGADWRELEAIGDQIVAEHEAEELQEVREEIRDGSEEQLTIEGVETEEAINFQEILNKDAKELHKKVTNEAAIAADELSRDGRGAMVYQYIKDLKDNLDGLHSYYQSMAADEQDADFAPYIKIIMQPQLLNEARKVLDHQDLQDLLEAYRATETAWRAANTAFRARVYSHAVELAKTGNVKGAKQYIVDCIPGSDTFRRDMTTSIDREWYVR